MSGARAAWLLALASPSALASACAARHHPEASPPPPVDVGTPADVHTSEGAADGFRVGTCQLNGYRVFYIQGIGEAHALPRDPKAWTLAVMEHARSMLATAVASGSGFGLGCSGVGLSLWVDHWRKVDAAIESVGASLRANGLADTVTISVSPVPIPL